ncbi:oligosaccharide flippase family protein [Haloferax sp. DFSO60]|uniref:oligosaccharide flippase family protein n=1 Tax=Haloferax sp. DFSO60 TaxID=3388652 RepID=UPI00397A57C9
MSRDLTSGFLSILNGKILTSVVGILSLPLIVRVLGPTGYGNYAFLLSTFSLLMILVSSGVTEGTQKFIAEERGDVDRWQAGVVGFYLKLAVVLAVIGSVTLVLLTASGVLQQVLDREFEVYFYLLAVLVITVQLRSFIRRALLGLGLEPYSESLTVVEKIILVGVGLGLASIGLGVAGFLVAQAIGSTVVLLVGVIVLSRRLSIRAAIRKPMSSLPYRELLSFNGLNIVLVLLMTSLFHVDIMMLRLLVSGEQTGFYKAALELAEYIWLIPTAFQTLMLHSTSKMWSRGEHERISDLAGKVTRYVFLITSLLVIGVFTLADRFIPIYYGAEFSVVYQPLSYLLLGAFGFALAIPISGINTAKGRLWPLIGATALAALGNVTLNGILIPQYGMIGAAVATSISYGSMFFLHVACGYYLGYQPLAGLRPVRIVATAVVSFPLIFSLESVIANDIIALVLVPPVGFLLFWAVALGTGAIDRKEVRLGLSAIPFPVPKVSR